MKFKKFLPLALFALMLTTPAVFAATGQVTADQQDETYTLQLAKYFDIQKTSTNTNPTSKFTLDYTVITLDAQPQTVFTVFNNEANKKVYFHATCPTSAGTAPAIGGTKDAPILAFSNNTATSGNQPTASEVSDALGGATDPADNANVIAFKLTATPALVIGTTAPKVEAIDTTKGQINYEIQNGKYTFTYTVASTNEANTFSVHDEYGNYVSNITLTSTSL